MTIFVASKLIDKNISIKNIDINYSKKKKDEGIIYQIMRKKSFALIIKEVDTTAAVVASDQRTIGLNIEIYCRKNFKGIF